MTSPTLANINPPDEPNVLFHDASWEFYEALLAEFGEQPKRVNFDRGTLEIMTISVEHEGYKELVGGMVSDIVAEFDIPIARRGSSTLKLEAKQRGLESDLCYWIANEQVLRGLKRIDLAVHPPPDLVVGIDISHAAVDRESIYAALGVPEMWHFDEQTLLTGWELIDGTWNRIERSKSFPMIRPADLNPFLKRLAVDGDTKVIRDFRDWLRTLPR